MDRLESAYTNCIPSAHSFEIDKVTTLVRIRSKTSQKPLRKSMYKCELVHYFEGPPICIFTHLWSIIFNSLFFFGNVDSATGTTTALFGHNHDHFITIPLPLRPILSKELRFGLEFTVKIKIGLY